MENNDIATIADLSDADLDMVAAGYGVHLSNIGNTNVSIDVPVQLNIAVLSVATQLNLSGIGTHQSA